MRGLAWPDTSSEKLNMNSNRAACFIRLNDAEWPNGVGFRGSVLFMNEKSGEFSPLSIDLTNEDEILINPLFFVI